MPIAHRTEEIKTVTKKIDASNKLNLDAIETLSDVTKKMDITKTPVFSTENPLVQEKFTEDEGQDEKTPKYSDTVIARLSKGKRNEFKSFFSKYGITMNSGIEMCIEYVLDQVNSGILKISKAGIK